MALPIHTCLIYYLLRCIYLPSTSMCLRRCIHSIISYISWKFSGIKLIIVIFVASEIAGDLFLYISIMCFVKFDTSKNNIQSLWLRSRCNGLNILRVCESWIPNSTVFCSILYYRVTLLTKKTHTKIITIYKIGIRSFFFEKVFIRRKKNCWNCG